MRILSVVPSLDAPVCAEQTKRFNDEAANLPGADFYTISCDLPTGMARFCGAENIKNVTSASEYKNSSFSDAYGVKITDSVLSGLLSRAIVVVDGNGKVIYTEQVPEIAQEPNYEKALNALKETAKA